MPNALARDIMGNLYVAGSTFNPVTNSVDMMLVKYNSTLSLIWSQKYDGYGYEDVAKTMDIDMLGNIYIGGYVEHPGENKNFILIKYDSDGNQIWNAERGNNEYLGNDAIKRIKLDGAGNIYVIGDVEKTGYTSMLVSCFDTDGNKLWEKESSGEEDAISSDIRINSYGDIFTLTKEKEEGELKTTSAKIKFYVSDNDIENDSTGTPSHYADQLIIKFNYEKLNPEIIGNRDISFTQLQKLVPSDVVQAMSEKVGVNLNEAIVCKVFRKLTPADSISISRTGEEVVLYPFWTNFVLHIPRVPGRVSDDMNVLKDSLLTLNQYIFDVYLNHICVPLSPPNDNFYAQMASLHPTSQFPDAHINIEDAWEIEIGKTNIKVGIYDFPVYWAHEDFGNGTYSGSKIKGGWDFVNNQHISSVTAPSHHHGTACAGIIGALRNNGTGVAGIAGGDIDNENNEGVQLFSLGIFYDYDNDPTTLNTVTTWSAVLAEAIVEGAASGPSYGYGLHVQNLSLATNQNNGFLRDAVLQAGKLGCVLVASRGNKNNTSPAYPACFSDRMIISVGANGIDGTRKTTEQYSGSDVDWGASYGAGMDFIAPGSADLIVTTQNAANPVPNFQFPGSAAYNYWNGTSAAAPHVSGVVALMLSRHTPQIGYPNVLVTEDVEEILQLTATDIVGDYDGTFYDINYDQYNGWGRINAGKALSYIKNSWNYVKHSAQPQSVSWSASPAQQINLASHISGVAPGTYQAIQYEVTHQYTETVPGWLVLNSYWPRILNSTGLSPGNPVVNEPYCNLSVLQQGSQLTITAKTYCWHITGNLQNQQLNSWIPAQPQHLKTAYSLLINEPHVLAADELHTGGVSVFPSPASESIFIHLHDAAEDSPVHVEVIDFVGRTVLKHQTYASPALALPIAHLAPGAYICKIGNGGNFYSAKFIKK